MCGTIAGEALALEVITFSFLRLGVAGVVETFAGFDVGIVQIAIRTKSLVFSLSQDCWLGGVDNLRKRAGGMCILQ